VLMPHKMPAGALATSKNTPRLAVSNTESEA
jgi:hypothetical protein